MQRRPRSARQGDAPDREGAPSLEVVAPSDPPKLTPELARALLAVLRSVDRCRPKDHDGGTVERHSGDVAS